MNGEKRRRLCCTCVRRSDRLVAWDGSACPLFFCRRWEVLSIKMIPCVTHHSNVFILIRHIKVSIDVNNSCWYFILWLVNVLRMMEIQLSTMNIDLVFRLIVAEVGRRAKLCIQTSDSSCHRASCTHLTYSNSPIRVVLVSVLPYF